MLFFFFFPAVQSLSWSTRDLSFGRQVLVPWPGIKLGPPALGAQCLNHWTTREVPYATCLFLPGVCTFASHSWNSFLTLLPFGWSFFLKKILDAAAAAKSLQLCPTLCDPIDGSPPGSPDPGILQARTLEWVAISFSTAWKEKWKWSRSVMSDP